MTKIFLVTGFLGSGKSTYLNKLLSDTDKKVGVLINEFGKISVDTITLSNKRLDLIELTNGSIFCACLKEKFIDGLIELIKMELDEIYVEASGLSDPSSMLSITEQIKKHLPKKEFEMAGTICMVDALYFLKQIEVFENIKRQIMHSHIVIINKVDLVDDKHVDKIRNIIEEINPHAKTENTSYGNVILTLKETSLLNILPEKSKDTVESRAYSMMLELVGSVSKDMIKVFFSNCEPYVLRAKGYFEIDSELYKLDVVNNSIKLKKIEIDTDLYIKEMNKIVLLMPKGLKGIKHIASTVGKVLKDKVILRN